MKWNTNQSPSQCCPFCLNLYMFTEHLLSTRLSPGPCLQRAHHLITEMRPQPGDHTAPVGRAQGSWSELKVKQWVVQEEAMDSPCLVGGATHTKVGAKRAPRTHWEPRAAGDAAGEGAGWRGHRAQPEGLRVPVHEPALHLAKPPRSSLRGLRWPAFYAAFWLRWIFSAARAFFSSCDEQRLPFSCRAWASHCSGFSCRVRRL